MMERTQLVDKINRLRKECNAVILAHNYVLGEVQEIADFVGDSLELSIKAAGVTAGVIVFCGVKFMAETAKILSPEKMVLHPAPQAGCPMADMATAEQVRALKRRHPDAVVVCYVNSTAEVKAEVDICCTSANAAKIVAAIPADREIIFMPDCNLGANIAAELRRKLILWPGCCPVHQRLTPEMVRRRRREFPNAALFVHPECAPEVVALADAALSTGGMLRYVRESEVKEFIVGTEQGIIYRLARENPDKTFVALSEQAICPDMKLTTLEDVLAALEKKQYQVDLPADILTRARLPISRMLEASV